MVRRCFPVAKIESSSLSGVALILPFLFTLLPLTFGFALTTALRELCSYARLYYVLGLFYFIRVSIRKHTLSCSTGKLPSKSFKGKLSTHELSFAPL